VQKHNLRKVLRGLSRQSWNPAALLTAIALTAAICGTTLLVEHAHTVAWTAARPPVPAAAAPPSPPLREIVGTFAKNQTVTDALARTGLPPRQIFEMVSASRPVYNLARVSAGRPFWLYLTPDGQFNDFRYSIDDEKYLTVYRDQGRFVPVIKKFPYEIRVEPVSGAIEGSLFGAISDAGERDALAESFAEIFTGDIDFYTDLQPGDSFRLLVEKKYLNAGFVKYGPILAATIFNQNRTLTGYRFPDERGRDGFYAPDGKSLKKSFLKSPLKFTRVSSKFSYARRHPVLKIIRPHLGVDYAAPIGTPVQAVGAGVVLLTGQTGANGNMIRLRHSGGYETMYLHLSRIAVRRGSRVDQTQVIGYVGATGLVTGPHLDFRVFFHGRPIDPRRVIFPPNPPVPPDRFAQFAQLRDMLNAQLERAAD
jgi:murein DD-endopeptidase MepM/ murein hydrolase activator NlpD